MALAKRRIGIAGVAPRACKSPREIREEFEAEHNARPEVIAEKGRAAERMRLLNEALEAVKSRKYALLLGIAKASMSTDHELWSFDLEMTVGYLRLIRMGGMFIDCMEVAEATELLAEMDEGTTWVS